jgi:hypothetical protein
MVLEPVFVSCIPVRGRLRVYRGAKSGYCREGAIDEARSFETQAEIQCLAIPSR